MLQVWPVLISWAYSCTLPSDPIQVVSEGLAQSFRSPIQNSLDTTKASSRTTCIAIILFTGTCFVEVMVFEECQRARLFNIDMVKSASRPLASVDGKLQIFMAKLVWSITRLMLAPKNHTKKLRNELTAKGKTKYPYKGQAEPPPRLFQKDIA